MHTRTRERRKWLFLFHVYCCNYEYARPGLKGVDLWQAAIYFMVRQHVLALQKLWRLFSSRLAQGKKAIFNGLNCFFVCCEAQLPTFHFCVLLCRGKKYPAPNLRHTSKCSQLFHMSIPLCKIRPLKAYTSTLPKCISPWKLHTRERERAVVCARAGEEIIMQPFAEKITPCVLCCVCCVRWRADAFLRHSFSLWPSDMFFAIINNQLIPFRRPAADDSFRATLL